MRHRRILGMQVDLEGAGGDGIRRFCRHPGGISAQRTMRERVASTVHADLQHASMPRATARAPDREQHSPEMSESLGSLHAMAFRSRHQRIIAIGNGMMVATRAAWILTRILIAGPFAVIVLYGCWFLSLGDRDVTEELIGYAISIAAMAMISRCFLQIVFIACGAVMFTGPTNSLGDRFRALVESRTVRWLLIDIALTIVLIVTAGLDLISPVEVRLAVMLTLTVLLAVADVAVSRSLKRVFDANRRRAYFEGMSESEKELAAPIWPEFKRPSFPEPEVVVSALDAERYARRATAIAKTHTWSGTGFTVIFSSFVGSSISYMWESGDPASQVPTLFVLGLVALGFWLQRRSQNYHDLSARFTARALEIDAAAAFGDADETESLVDRLRRWLRLTRPPWTRAA